MRWAAVGVALLFHGKASQVDPPSALADGTTENVPSAVVHVHVRVGPLGSTWMSRFQGSLMTGAMTKPRTLIRFMRSTKGCSVGDTTASDWRRSTRTSE